MYISGKAHQNRHTRLGGPVHHKQERDNQAHDDTNFDIPENAKEESQGHEGHINPRSHAKDNNH